MSDWHIPDELMASFLGGPGMIGDATSASIEQHLTACESCQRDVARLSGSEDLEAIWNEVQDGVDRLGSGLTERLLRWSRVESAPARLIAATPALRFGAGLSAALIVAVVVLVTRVADAGDAFLIMAPVLPTALVALSFAPGMDPAGECGLATPVFGFGLLVRRALAVEVLATLVLVVGSMFVPINGPRALAWLVPALALSLGTMAAGVRWPAPHAAVGLTMCWAAVLTLAYVSGGGTGVAESVVFDSAGQLVAGAAAGGACLIIAANRQVLFQEVNS